MEFTLRKFTLNDIDSIAKHANNQKIAKFLRDSFPYPYTRKDAEFFIKNVINTSEDKQCIRTIDINGEAVGSIGIFIQNDVYCKSGELGYWLSENYWKNGIISNAINQICNYCFNNYDIVRIYAEPYANNEGSKRVLEKNGFQLEGIMKKGVYKNNEFYDYCIYALIKE